MAVAKSANYAEILAKIFADNAIVVDDINSVIIPRHEQVEAHCVIFVHSRNYSVRVDAPLRIPHQALALIEQLDTQSHAPIVDGSRIGQNHRCVIVGYVLQVRNSTQSFTHPARPEQCILAQIWGA